jgi:hypothetical protein
MIGIRIMSKVRKIYKDVYSSVYVSIHKTTDGGRHYQGYISCNTSIGSFDICMKTFSKIEEWCKHVTMLLEMSSTYESDLQNPIRMFV